MGLFGDPMDGPWRPEDEVTPSGPIDREAFRLALAFERLHQLRPELLPDIATWALVGGVDSPALRELAGSAAVEVRDNRDLFEAACAELGISIVDEHAALRALVDSAVRATASERVPPIRGLGFISEYYNLLGRPDDLRPFEALYRQWAGWVQDPDTWFWRPAWPWGEAAPADWPEREAAIEAQVVPTARRYLESLRG